jgi:glucuronate isomerase
MPFIHEDFLLRNQTARRLYHQYAESEPILDYHCHLPPQDVASNRRFANLFEIWLEGDHYKWRAMRANGVPEDYCTGGAAPYEKFLAWARTVPRTLRNPLYHWTHLELARYFDISDRLLGPSTARAIWDAANERLAAPDMSCRGLMAQSRVALVCTTDDPTDSLEHHRALAADASFNIQVLPAWRPDNAMAVEDPAAFNAWTDRLALAADADIRDFDSFMAALHRRLAFFHEAGCRLSDHGLDTIYTDDYTPSKIDSIFLKLRAGRALDPDEICRFKSCMLYEFGVMDHERGWTQQYHLGALRNTLTAPLG